MYKIVFSGFCFLSGLLLMFYSSVAFAQYPDKYCHYRSIPKDSYGWNRALVFYANNEFDSALFYASKAEHEFLEIDAWESYLFINNFKAQLLGEAKRPKDAINVLNGAHDSAKNLIDTLRSIEYAENLFLTGRVYSLVNDYKKSELFFKRSATVLEQSGKYPEVLAIVYFTLFQLNDKLMNNMLAQEYLLKAIRTVRGVHGDYAKAVYYYIQAEGLDKSQPLLKKDFYEAAVNAFEDGGFLNDYFYYFSLLKLSQQFSTYQPNYEKAVCYCGKAEEYALKNSITRVRIYSLYLALGDTYRSFNRYEEALKYFQKAKDITLECFGEKSFEFLLANLYIGRMYRYVNDYAESAKYYSHCYNIGTKGWKGRFPHEFTIYGELGRLYLAMEMPDSALCYAQKRLCYDYKGIYLSVDQIPPIPDSKNLLRYYNSLALKIEAYKQLYEKTNDTAILSLALTHCDHANQLLEKLNEKSVEEYSGLKNSARVKTISSFAVYFSLQQFYQTNNESYLRKAVECCEESKANYLKCQLNDRFYGVKDSIQDIIKQRIASLEEQQQNQSVNQNFSLNKLFADSILNLKSQFLERIIEKGSDRNLATTINPKDIPIYDFDSIQRNIPNSTCIVVYQVLDFKDEEDDPNVENNKDNCRLVVFCIDNQHINHYVETINDENIQLVQKFKSDIKIGDMSNFYSSGHQIYDMLLKPFEKTLLAMKNVVLVSDSRLPDIPFECLSINENGILLCYRLATSYHYSIGLWNRSRSQTTGNCQKGFIAIAPDYTAEIGNYELIEEYGKNVERDAKGLKPLLMAKEEVSQIGELFKNRHETNVKIEKDGVTKGGFKKLVNNYGIVHIASHGYADKDDYRNSGIYFSGIKGDTCCNSNFLSLREIYDLKIDANLVVLSACKTSVGDKLKGEGTMALPRGFIYAGVPNVIASLWKVHDDKTKDFMVSFYRHFLEDKVSYPEALRLAKLDCIKKDFTPMDWSGFVLIGE